MKIKGKSFVKKLLYITMSLIICLLIMPISSSRGDSFNQISPTDNNVTYKRVIMQNKMQKDLGTNGAGCQWPVSLESSNDGSLMLYGIDVAGLYKSTDHGENWTLAASGMGSRGVGMFAIDPRNTNHIIALGLGTKVGAFYVSYDKAETWEKKTDFKTNGSRYLWDGLEFDPTSYDSASNTTKNVYFSTPYKRDTYIRTSPSTEPASYSVITEDEVGLYKSTDGGENFSLIINDARLADGIVKVTDSGNVYVGSQHGLFLINKENNTIEKTYLENDAVSNYSKGVTGLDVVGNTIYVQNWDGIYTLANDTLTKITNDNYINTWPQFLEVSKSNPNHIIYQVRSNVNNYYVSNSVVSFDGGNTWQYSETERNSLFFRSNWEGREKLFIIDPSNDNNVITFGSDDLVRSTNGGLNFKQTKGISNLMQGGRFNFNYYDPDLLFFSAQDYTGVISTDGGKSYSAISIPGKGNFYGGFAADKDTIYGFSNESWNGGSLTYTHDGGDTWTDTGLKVPELPGAVYYSSLQSPTDPNVLFAAKYYSKDKGYTWNVMNGCINVFTFNYTGDKELYGTDSGGNIVVSYNNGDTWQKLSQRNWNSSNRLTEQTILDLAYDHKNNIAYFIVMSKVATYTIEEVYKYNITNNETTKLNVQMDTNRSKRLKSISVDPNSTSVIYVGGAGDYFSSPSALTRSIDGGANWSVLTTSNKYPLKATNQGGYEVSTVRVNPYDGRVWIACGCYGYETLNPPYDSSLVQNSKPQNCVIKYMYNGTKVNEVTLKNNEKHNYVYDEDGLTFVNWYKDEQLTKEFPIGSNVYSSMTLYAKMKESIKVSFYDRNQLLWKMDLDRYDKGDKNQIPTREGYAFAGWYSDINLTTKADFSNITQDTKVYAGWYKVIEDVFDINKKDVGNYINYNTYAIQNGKEVSNNEYADDRCVQAKLDKNSTYLITFKMDNRFRLGMKRWIRNPVVDPKYIDERDVNGKNPVNEYVYKVIETTDSNNTDLLVNYYSWTSTRAFMDIKSTFNIYKIESSNVQDNNDLVNSVHEHILIKVPANPATCETDGTIEYYKCTECNKLFKDSMGEVEISLAETKENAKGHDWGDWEITTPATVDSEGEETRICRNDSSHKETKSIEKLKAEDNQEVSSEDSNLNSEENKDSTIENGSDTEENQVEGHGNSFGNVETDSTSKLEVENSLDEKGLAPKMGDQIIIWVGIAIGSIIKFLYVCSHTRRKKFKR